MREKVGKGMMQYEADSIFTSDIVKRENAREGWLTVTQKDNGVELRAE